MDATTLRTLISTRIAALDISTRHAARLADLPTQVVYDYLRGADTTTARALALASAVGLNVSVTPRPGFAPAPPPRRAALRKSAPIP